MSIRRASLATAFLMAAAIAAFGQTPTGRINGAVTDPSGAVVPAAQVEAVNAATGTRTTGVTNESGIYQLNFLNPGRYDLTATAGGFRKYVCSSRRYVLRLVSSGLFDRQSLTAQSEHWD